MKYAEVDFWLGSYEATVSVLDALKMTPVEPGPGVTHDEAVQMVSSFAVWRDYCAYGGSSEVAFFREGKFYYASDTVTASQYKAIMGTTESGHGKESTTALFVWGNGPRGQSATLKPGKGLPEDWGDQLAGACDWCIEQFATAKHAPSQPAQGGERPVAILLPAAALTTAIIVSGAAVAVIGSVAAWRFFDPKTRTAMAGIAAASNAYMGRIATFKETGTMPPPSEVEKGAKDAVEKAANSTDKEAWMQAALFGGGIVGGTVLASFINSRIRGAA